MNSVTIYGLGIIGAVALTVLLGVVSNEVFAWLRPLTRRITVAASRRFRDSDMGERYLEEWQSTISEIPGPVVALIHALSLFFCVRETERLWSTSISTADIEERFDELMSAAHSISQKLQDARARKRITLAQIAQVTKISVDTLRAMERGQFHKIPQGIYIFSYLKDMSGMIGLDVPAVQRQYASLLYRSAGLPPAPVPSFWQRLARIRCALAGHVAYERHFHSRTPVPFHWTYKRCDRCGGVSTMWAEQCGGRTVRGKLDVDSPVTEKLSCDIRPLSWYSATLDAPQRVGELKSPSSWLQRTKARPE